MNEHQNILHPAPAEEWDNRLVTPAIEPAETRTSDTGGPLPLPDAIPSPASPTSQAPDGEAIPGAEAIQTPVAASPAVAANLDTAAAGTGGRPQGADGIESKENFDYGAREDRGIRASIIEHHRLSSEKDLVEAQARANICEQFASLVHKGLSKRQAARALKKSVSWFSGDDSVLARYKRAGLAGLVQRSGGLASAAVSDLTHEIESLPWFIPAAQFLYLITNRTSNTGSLPEAITRTISLPVLPIGWTQVIIDRFLKHLNLDELPVCPESVRNAIAARHKARQQIVPKRIARQITNAVSRQIVEQYRRPHETALNYLSCPGSAMISRHNGIQEFFRAGDTVESDDGSINLPVCIPWTSPNGGLITETPCSAAYGVIVGRFQWLRLIDCGTRFRPGWAFVARARGSYRGADVQTLLRGATIQHGIWNEYRFEQGVFKSETVRRTIELMNSRLHTVLSARGKPFVEGGFSHDWTKLSVHFPQCDLGRYAGDTEEANKLLQNCRAGRTDPRRYFPMLKDVLAAFDAITEEQNRSTIKSSNYGQWIPEERWNRELAERPMRKLDSALTYMFEPYALTWKVRGALVGGRVPIFEGMSVPFDFTSPWLHRYHGCRLRLHFDPSAHRCIAVPVLMQDWQGQRAGTVLDPLYQVNETTGYIRMVLGWGDDPGTAGLKAKQQSAVAMRRDVRTIMPGGKSGYSRSEVKALDQTGILERNSRPAEDGRSKTEDGSPSRAGTGPSSIINPPSSSDRTARRAALESLRQETEHLFV